MGTASARPDRLKRFGTTTDAVRDGLLLRAGNLRDAWDTYQATNSSEWRFDFADLPDAIEAFADTLANIGAFTRGVGEAFEEADDDSDVVTTTDARIRRLVDDRWVPMLEGPAANRCAYVDWGDPDDPPAWLEALRTTSLVFGHAGDGSQTLAVSFVQAVSGYTRADGTVVDGYLRYRPGTGGRALLGSFASASSLAKFDRWFGGAADVFGGFAAGMDQWSQDDGTLNYTSEEQLQRALIRGGGTALAGLGGGALGAAAAPLACGPGAPVCAGVVIVGTGLAVSGVGDWILDRVLPSPAPAEHDPDLVRESVHVSSNQTDPIYDAVGLQGRDAANRESDSRARLFESLAMVEGSGLPSRIPVIDYTPYDEYSDDEFEEFLESPRPDLWDDHTGWIETGSHQQPPLGPLSAEEIEAIAEYERSLAGG